MFERSGVMGRAAASLGSRVLVVGTTPDYIELLRRSHPDICCFLTESRLRRAAQEPQPQDHEEVLFGSTQLRSAIKRVERHQIRHGIEIAGIACFDCESLPLASLLAKRFGLPYPSRRVINRCRNKRRMKQRWTRSQVPTPRFLVVHEAAQARRFLRQVGGPCIMKPLTGSGSELVFRVTDEAECQAAFETVIAGLDQRRAAPLFRSCQEGQRTILMEESVRGPEFSCDFIVENQQVRVIRLTRKHLRKAGPAGTIEAYELSSDVPEECQDLRLAPWLQHAAESLGIERAVCMADFILRDGEPVFLEVTPRCGGDCLPSLLRAACGFDILGLVIAFARGPVAVPTLGAPTPTVAPPALRGAGRPLGCHEHGTVGERPTGDLRRPDPPTGRHDQAATRRLQFMDRCRSRLPPAARQTRRRAKRRIDITLTNEDRSAP